MDVHSTDEGAGGHPGVGVPAGAAPVRRAHGALVLVSAVVVGAAVVVCTLAVLATPVVADARPGPTWTWPLPGPAPVTRGYDPPAVRYGTGHRGADLEAAAGDKVLAAGAGRISYAGLLAGRGVVVVVHGDLRTTYEPVDAEVAVGQVVEAGAVLGRLAGGHAGCPSAACLHWGLRRGEQYLDPLSLVRPGPVRLLPVPATLSGAAPGSLSGSSPDAAAPRAADGAASGAAAGPASAPDAGPPGPEPTSEPFDLRAAATPSAALAAAALLAGVVLLAAPRPPGRPDGGAAAAAAVVVPEQEQDERPLGAVLDLGRERARRGAAPW